MLLCYDPIIGQFIPKTNFGSGIPDLDSLRTLAYLLVLTYLTEAAMTKYFFVFNTWLKIVFFYVSVVCASPLWSPHYSYNSVTLQQLFNSVLLPAVIALIAFRLFRYKDIIRRYATHLTVASIILSVISLVQFLKGSSVIHGQVRSMATFVNPNALAIYLVLSLPVVLYAGDTGKIGRWSGKFAQILIIMAIFTTVSRKGLATMLVVYAIYYMATRQYKMFVIGMVGLIGIGIIALGFSEISSRFSSKDIATQVEGKAEMAMAGFNMFSKNPLIGLGYNGYYENFGKYFPFSYERKYDAHNEYVTALANYGIVGFAPFILIFTYPLARGWRRFKVLKKPAMSDDRLRILVGLISVITFSMNQYYAGAIFYQENVVFMLYANIALMLVVPYENVTIRTHMDSAATEKKEASVR